MEEQSMYLDPRGVYHGEARCQWNGRQKFKCHNCERWICYCGGHDNSTTDCKVMCDDCCTCLDFTH